MSSKSTIHIFSSILRLQEVLKPTGSLSNVRHYVRNSLLREYVRLEIKIMLALRHLHERIGKIRLSGFLFGEPYFVETLSADTAAQMGMKLDDQVVKVSQQL